jgi:hypothetical protein
MCTELCVNIYVGMYNKNQLIFTLSDRCMLYFLGLRISTQFHSFEKTFSRELFRGKSFVGTLSRELF